MTPDRPLLLTVPDAIRALGMREDDAMALLRQHGLIGQTTVVVTRGGRTVVRTIERVAADRLAALFDPERRQEEEPSATDAPVVTLRRRPV